MNVVSFDTETELIRPGRLAPPLVCLSASDDEDCALYHHTEARAAVELLLESDSLLVGDNVAYDFSVICAKWPDLMPLVFEVYENDRVSDTEIREKLVHIAVGKYRGFRMVDGKPEKLNYSLADLVWRHLGIRLEKGTWQLRFGELNDVPLDEWPEEARDYAIMDAVVTLEVWKSQQTEARLLEDEFRQSRAAWWLQLMSCWGMRTDPEGVREFARITQQKYDAIAEGLREAGLLRADGTRNVKAVQERVTEAYIQKALDEFGVKVIETIGGTRHPLAKVETKLVVEDKKVKNLISVDGKRSKTFIEMTPTRKPKTDADVCGRSGDSVLENYAELSSLTKVLSTDIPLLEQAVRVPLKVRFESLMETGRTSSSPNVQNWSTDIGMRECVRARDGYVFASADYSGFELRTWSQVCLTCLGQSKLAEVLNAGMDPHLEIARRILGISYEEAEASFKKDPKGVVYYPRQTGKIINFGSPGGLGVKRLIDYARKGYGVILFETPEEARENNSPVSAEELRAYWREAWPESKLYFDWIGKQCDVPVPVIRQIFVNRYRGDVRFTEAANTLFQGLAADAAKAAGFLIAKACYVDTKSPLFGCRPINFVHDEFLVEVPDDERAHDAAVELARLMVVGASPFLPDVPPVAEPMLGRKWSKAAKAVRGLDGRLVPWDFPKKGRAA